MKNLLKNVSFVILLLKMCFIFGQESTAQKRIIIDVGHGGKDAGAIGINGIKEKDVVLSIANEILRLNNDLEKPLDIYLTRYKDTLISLSDRTKLAKALKADLLVSLHCNHSNNPDARGMEVYVANTMSIYSNDATWFAFQLQDELNRKLGFESRGVKFANFQVLRETANSCSSILVELGFLSNRDESDYLANSKQNKMLAFLIINSLKKRR
tara:strand:+ start:2018 stop:2653 length:636 start_codon:yes stop_codon:yes gene_type:complete